MTSFFPSPTVAKYMVRLFLTRTFGLLAALVLILQTLDLLGESGSILAHPGNTQAQVWAYVTLRAPQIIAFLLPFSVLLGAIATFFTMNQNSEVIALKAGGLSAHQVLAPLLLASLGVAGVSFVFNERIVTRATATLDQWKDVNYGALPIDRGERTNVWVRDGDDLITVQQVRGRGNATRLGNVTVYDRTAGRLEAIITAAHGHRVAGGWEIDRATRFDVATGKLEPLGRVKVAADVRPDQFTLGNVNPDGLDFTQLSAAIGDLRDAGRPTKSLEGTLWHKFSGPVGSADAAARRGRGVRHRAIGPVVNARGDRHGARLCLFRRGQFRAGDGQSGRLPAFPGGLGAVPAVPADWRGGADPHRGIARQPG